MNSQKIKHILSVILFIVFGILAVGTSDSDPGKSTGSSSTPDPKKLALGQVFVKNFEWSKGGFGNIMMLDINIENVGDNVVKDVEITCDSFSNSGTKVDSNQRIVYEIIPARGTKKVKRFNMGFIHSQANSTNCRVTDLVLMQ